MNYLDKRVRRLEVDKPANSDGRARLVIVPCGGDSEAEIAKLADRQPGDQLLVVQLVRPSDVQHHGGLTH